MLLGGRFFLERPLGGGGAATVWLAQDRESSGPVAVKMLHPHFRAVENARMRVAREAELLTKLSHPNIARALSLVLDIDTPYFAIEYVSGLTLSDAMGQRAGQRRTLDLQESSKLFFEIVQGMSHAHQAGIVHRDLKPANIMLQQGSSQVKILDFGLAKVLEQNEYQATTQGRRLGSVAYMSPEQTRGDGIDIRSDVFALGIILFELLTLRRAWALNAEGTPVWAFSESVPNLPQNTVPSVIRRINGGPRPRPTMWLKHLPAEVDAVLAKATAIKPKDRYESALELWDDFLRVVGPLELSQHVQIVPPEAPVAMAMSARAAPRPPTLVRPEDSSQGGDGQGTIAEPEPVVKTTVLDGDAAPTTVKTRYPNVVEPYQVVESVSQLAPTPSGGRAKDMLMGAALGGAVVLGGGLLWQNFQPQTPVPVQISAQPEIAPSPAVAAAARPVPSVRSTSEKVAPDSSNPPKSPKPRTAIEPSRRRHKTIETTPRNSKTGRARLVKYRQKLQADPADVQNLEALRKEILRKLPEVSDQKKRGRIKRITNSSAMMADADGLLAAARELEQALP